MLTDEQVHRFATDGHIVVPGVVPERWLAPADAEIDGVIADAPPPEGKEGPHFYFLPPGRLPAADAALRRSGALAVAEQLVAPQRLDYGLDHIQVALNIPHYSHRPGGPHLDGHRPEQTVPGSFTMLAAIYLCDESVPDSGNLWVWPGSHRDRSGLAGVTCFWPTTCSATTSVGTPARRPDGSCTTDSASTVTRGAGRKPSSMRSASTSPSEMPRTPQEADRDQPPVKGSAAR